jgi:hypothetical protein
MRILIVCCLLLLPVGGFAKNLYVNNSGTPACSDSTTYANNSASSPWCTFGRAVWGQATYSTTGTPSEAAQAGDTVIVSPGTYTGPQTNSKFLCAFSPVNNGSAGSYITFKAEYPSSTTTTGNRTVLETTGAYAQGSGGCVIGGSGESYHIWDGFYIDIDNAYVKNDTGPVVAWASDYITFQNLYITATTTPVANTDDNLTGIRVEQANHITIKNNYIENILSSNDHGAAVQGYNSRNVLIEHNEVRTSNDGIYAKGEITGQQTQLDWIVRYNLCVDNEHGVLTGGVEGIDIYQNIITGSIRAFRVLSYTTPRVVPLNVNFYNNTVADNTYGFFWSNADEANNRNMILYNNIFSGGTRGVYWEGPNTKMYNSNNDVDFSYNYYQGSTTETNVAWATWTGATYGQDAGATQGSGTLYVNSSTGNYKLEADSPARTVSSTSGPVGAYITGNEEIGIQTGLGISGGSRINTGSTMRIGSGATRIYPVQ